MGLVLLLSLYNGLSSIWPLRVLHSTRKPMTNYEQYVKHSYDVIRRAENLLAVVLDEPIEAYLVHLFAHYMDKPKVNTEPVCIKLLESTHKPTKIKQHILKEVGDECLLIHSMEWGRLRWPSDSYYHDMGQTAYVTRAFSENPPDIFFDDLAMDFDLVTKILRNCRN